MCEKEKVISYCECMRVRLVVLFVFDGLVELLCISIEGFLFFDFDSLICEIRCIFIVIECEWVCVLKN